MASHHLNPNVSETAARYLCKAMTRVNPLQRAELLESIIAHAEACLRQIRTGSAERRAA